MVRTRVPRALVLACSAISAASFVRADDSQPSTTSTASSSTTTPDSTLTPQSTTSTASTSPQPFEFFNYFYVFVAVAICIIGLGVFFFWRRRRLLFERRQGARQNALAEDLSGWGERGRRRYWQGRWRSAQASREEGLNEEGEAPPPYLPKHTEHRTIGPDGEDTTAVPLQTLSRDAAGLKPPDYTEVHPRPVSFGGTNAHTNESGRSEYR